MLCDAPGFEAIPQHGCVAVFSDPGGAQRNFKILGGFCVAVMRAGMAACARIDPMQSNPPQATHPGAALPHEPALIRRPRANDRRRPQRYRSLASRRTAGLAA